MSAYAPFEPSGLDLGAPDSALGYPSATAVLQGAEIFGPADAYWAGWMTAQERGDPMRSDARKKFTEDDPYSWGDSSDVIGQLRDAEAKLSRVRQLAAEWQAGQMLRLADELLRAIGCAPDFDAMSDREFEAYPDTASKRDYIVSLYRKGGQ